jgi:cytochrome b
MGVLSQAMERVRVWDPFVRLFHWSLVGLFLIAWATGEEWGYVHTRAGYAIAGLLAARIIWGFVGTKHARFSSFVYSPRTVLAFLADTARLKARRYLGHNPAGGVMVIALMVMIALITATGIMMTTDAFRGVEWVGEAHEALVNVAIVLVILHVAGVVLASFEHSENLVRAMVTGWKRPG